MGAEKSASTNERCDYQPRRLNTRMITRLFVKFVCKVFSHARWEAGLKSGCGKPVPQSGRRNGKGAE